MCFVHKTNNVKLKTPGQTRDYYLGCPLLPLFYRDIKKDGIFGACEKRQNILVGFLTCVCVLTGPKKKRGGVGPDG